MYARHDPHRGTLSIDIDTGSMSYVTGGITILNGSLDLLNSDALYGRYLFENSYELGLYCAYSANCSNYDSSLAYCWLSLGCYGTNCGPSLPSEMLVYEGFWDYCFRFLRILFTDILS